MIKRRPRLTELEIREFLARDYGRFVNAMRLVSGNLPAAEDAVQEALARAWERSERGQRIESLTAFVATTARNLLRDRFRRLLVERRARRELAERVALAVAVVAGSVGGGVGLIRLFGAGDRARVGSGGDEPTSSPSEGSPVVSAFCESRDVLVDLDGDGERDDLIETLGETSQTGVSCEESPPLQRFVVHLVLDAEANVGPSFPQELPECADPYACRVIATPDVDRDGRPEIAIKLGAGVSAIHFALYRFDPTAPPNGSLHRLEIAEPGDPWHGEFGFPPGPATFSWFDPSRTSTGSRATRTPSTVSPRSRSFGPTTTRMTRTSRTCTACSSGSRAPCSSSSSRGMSRSPRRRSKRRGISAGHRSCWISRSEPLAAASRRARQSP